jgi:Fe-S-cluster containining protein
MKIEPDTKGIAWICRMCGKCCDSPTITKKDIANISGYLKISFEECVKKYLNYFDGLKGEVKEVNGKCIFLNGNKCSIYKVRPLICRVRPYSPQLKNGELILTYDGWFLENCSGLFVGDLPVEKEYLKYGIAVVKYLGVEEPTPNELFEKFKKRKIE